MSKHRSRSADRKKIFLWAMAPVLALPLCLLWAIYTIAHGDDAPASFAPDALGDADQAAEAGSDPLSLARLREAVRSAPENSEAHLRLAIALMRSGQDSAAERELRDAIGRARNDNRTYETAVPYLLRLMRQRGGTKALLAEFSDPPQGTSDTLAPDILNARAFALQSLQRPAEAREAMDRSLALRRDAAGLVSSAVLAQQQGDLTLARRQTDEAIERSPANEGAWTRSVQLARESGDMRQALASVDEFLKRVPHSLIARALRIEVLHELHEDARAKQDIDVLLVEAPRYGQFYQALAMARARDPAGAWALLQTLPPEFIQGQAFRTMMTAGIAAASGYVNSGEAILTTFVSSHPGDRLARLDLAAMRLNQGAPGTAIDVLETIATADDPIVHALLAQAYLRLQRYGKAIESLEIVSAVPKPTHLMQRQLVLSDPRAGESDEIVQGLRMLLEGDPGNVAIAAPLMAALADRAEWDEALATAKAIAGRVPGNPFPAFYEGQILVARGDLAGAELAFGKALAIDPNFVPALYYRANVLAARGKSEAAKNDLQNLSAQNPANALASIRLAEMAADAGKDEEVLTLLDQSWQRFAGDPATRFALANYQTLKGRYREAEAALDQMLRLSSNDPEGVALQGRIQFLRGQTAQAIATFRSLATGNTSSLETYALLARALYETKSWAEAEKAARMAIELAPGSVRAQALLIDVEIGAGKPESAADIARAYAGTNPGLEADVLLAGALLRLKRSGEAQALLVKLADANATPRRVLSLGFLAAAIAPQSPDICDAFGWLEYRRGNSPEALALLQQAHAMDKTNARVSYHLALALDAAGKRADAKTLLRAALAKDAAFDGADHAKDVLAHW
jgi:putative PEP-CTERM system TPR-repeat lipoprotein